LNVTNITFVLLVVNKRNIRHFCISSYFFVQSNSLISYRYQPQNS